MRPDQEPRPDVLSDMRCELRVNKAQVAAARRNITVAAPKGDVPASAGTVTRKGRVDRRHDMDVIEDIARNTAGDVIATDSLHFA
ncbi:hypothetical protein [Yoonia sp.]|uniref:hypothetical protein n=1 Tax=Yoonia sp. TaxID=2212373 RepID=UPI003F6B7D66